MIRSARRSLFPTALLVLAACGQELTAGELVVPPPINDESMVTVTAQEFRVRSDGGVLTAAIPFVLINQTTEQISLKNCAGGYGVVLERREGTRWVHAWTPERQDCLSPPILLGTGEAMEDIFRLRAGAQGSSEPPPLEGGAVPGTYRIVILDAYWDYNHAGPPWGTAVPRPWLSSNSFDLRPE